MALPPTKKEIALHPAPDSVTAPVDKQEKDVDVERKVSQTLPTIDPRF